MTKKTPAGGREDAVQGTQHADTRAAGEKPAKASETDRATGDASDFGVVGVCGSAGALEAFQILLDNLPTPLGLALVIVPHLDPSHPSLMAQLLASHTPMRVEEVADGVALAPDRVYVIPPGRFLAVANGRLLLSPVADGDASATGRQTVIDLFLRSLAEDLEHRALGVVLSGTGSLGTLGLREIKEHGGVTLVQDPASAGFDSMPRSAIAAGVADRVLSPKAIAGALVDYARRARASGHWRQGADADTEPEQLGAILALLRARTKYDFRCYRKGMLLRRVRRRMGLRQLTDLPEYVARLRSDGEELGLLFRDLLIGVTGFFRDPKAFEVLEQRVLDPLARRADGDRPVRIWVPGCASGEEAYSIAMLTIEAFARRQRRPNLQIFATDINDQALETARQGRYPKGIAADVSPRRLQRFFVEAGSDSYRVTKQLRDAVVFAPQNLISDAPFSKLDLVSCRNLLIYLEPEVQRQIVAVFHFALRPDGYLLLGPSEGVGQRTDLFATVSKRWRLFRRAGPSRSCDVLFPAASAPGDPRSLTRRARAGARVGEGCRARGTTDAARRVRSSGGADQPPLRHPASVRPHRALSRAVHRAGDPGPDGLASPGAEHPAARRLPAGAARSDTGGHRQRPGQTRWRLCPRAGAGAAAPRAQGDAGAVAGQLRRCRSGQVRGRARPRTAGNRDRTRRLPSSWSRS